MLHATLDLLQLLWLLDRCMFSSMTNDASFFHGKLTLPRLEVQITNMSSTLLVSSLHFQLTSVFFPSAAPWASSSMYNIRTTAFGNNCVRWNPCSTSLHTTPICSSWIKSWLIKCSPVHYFIPVYHNKTCNNIITTECHRLLVMRPYFAFQH